jgi:hypothetical protein
MTRRPRPCPRCGSGAVKIVATKGKHYAHCVACQYSGPEQSNVTEAFEVWDTDAIRKGLAFLFPRSYGFLQEDLDHIRAASFFIFREIIYFRQQFRIYTHPDELGFSHDFIIGELFTFVKQYYLTRVFNNVKHEI